MERKTHVHAEAGKQELVITRQFDLPVDLVYLAYTEPELLEQWMGTRVLKLDAKNQGGYVFETTDPKGNKHGFHGVIHEIVPDRKITRTFEMSQAPFDVQLEFLEFEPLTESTSRLTIHILYRSVQQRDQVLQLPFAKGINMAHNRLQEAASRTTLSRRTDPSESFLPEA
ncbi:MAG TPA: SRPBCC domain-containing protein [Flavisolibacter sp.]|jgi:uncharacterized protein YndB with AHSA1/START domain|nr:SRPBCC domain-containing protein [Flavisolibacter sp.]